MKCAVITPVGPGHEQLALEAKASVERAYRADAGPFSDLTILQLPDPEGAYGRSRRRNEGLEHARRQGADWVFFLDADDVMTPRCFAAVAPHVESCDAVFGLIAEAAYGDAQATLREDQIRSISGVGELLRHHPYLTLQMGHFVRTDAARAIRFDESMDAGEDVKYYLNLWLNYKCLKIDEALFVNRRGAHAVGPRSATGKQWSDAVSKVMADFCIENGIVASFEAEGKQIRFAIGNPLDLIQQRFLNGGFFEEAELAYLRRITPPGAVIVDVGANVGNHAVYFELLMAAKKVLAIEPNPAAIALLKQNAALNGLVRLDLSLLGCGVGERDGRFDIDAPDPRNLGAVRLVATDGGGAVAVRPLDDLVREPVDLIKIDVEWMEMEALRGAADIVRRDKPVIFIEIMNDNLAAFASWRREMAYEVVKEFQYVNARNFVIAPAGSPLIGGD